MSKKTMREQIEKIRQLDPAMLKFLKEYDDEKLILQRLKTLGSQSTCASP